MPGWSHENTAFVLGSFLIVISLFNIKKLFSLPKREKLTLIISIIIFGIGAILLIFCPGNFHRLGSGGFKLNYDLIISNILDIKYMIVIYVITLLLVFIAKFNDYKREIKNELLYFILPGLIGGLPMLLLNEFPPRAMLAYETVLVICIINNVKLIQDFIKQKNYALINKLGLVCTFLIAFLSIYALSYKAWFAYKYIKPYKEEMINELRYCKISGMDEAVITQFKYLDKAMELDVYMDMFPKVSDISIINSYCANYYGLKSVTALPEGYSLLEINLSGENDIVTYNAIDKNTNEIVATRILGTELQLPDRDYKNRICFLIKEEDLDNIILDIPEEIISKITSSRLIKIGKIEEIDLNTLLQ